MFANLRTNYGQDTMKVVRRFIRCHVTVERQAAHLFFNHRCKEERIITPAMRVKPLFNTQQARRLASSQTWQNLNLRIGHNHDIINKELKKMVQLGAAILHSTSEEEFVAIIGFAKHTAEQDAKKLQDRHKKKLDHLRAGKTKDRNFIDTSRWVLNVSDKQLSATEIEVLQKGLQFAVVPKRIPSLNIISSIEDGIRHLDTSDKDLIRAEVTNVLINCNDLKPNLSKEQNTAIRDLKKDRSVCILKADKGNCTVVMNSLDYDNKINALLSDSVTYTKIKNNPVKKIERSMNSKLLKLNREEKLNDSLYFNLRSTDGILPRIYG